MLRPRVSVHIISCMHPARLGQVRVRRTSIKTRQRPYFELSGRGLAHLIIIIVDFFNRGSSGIASPHDFSLSLSLARMIISSKQSSFSLCRGKKPTNFPEPTCYYYSNKHKIIPTHFNSSNMIHNVLKLGFGKILLLLQYMFVEHKEVATSSSPAPS